MAKPKTKRAVPDRSKISMVGNSAASVRKELKSYDLLKRLQGTETVKSG